RDRIVTGVQPCALPIFGGVDGVGECVHALGVGAGPLHGDLQGDLPILVLRFEVDDLGVDQVHALGGVQVGHVVHQTAVVLVGDGAGALGLAVLLLGGLTGDLVAGLAGTLVGQGDAQRPVQE